MDNEQLLQALSDMMDKKFDEKLSPINNRLDSMENRLDNMESRLDSMDNRLDSMENRLDNMDNRLDKLESQVSALRTGQIELRKEVKEIDIKVSDTYQLALDAWGTSTENRNWIEKNKLTV